MKVVLISGHDAESDRRTGFHFWKDILAERGQDVRFLTVGLSWLSLVKRRGSRFNPPFNSWISIDRYIKKFVWCPFFHPVYVGRGLLSRVTTPLFRMYPNQLPRQVLDEVRDADLFIVENGAGPLLAPLLRKNSPRAVFVYNASDRLDVVDFHPVVVQESINALSVFNLIRCNAKALMADFAVGLPVIYVPQGVDKEVFDRNYNNPYLKPLNAVCVGDMLFDADAVTQLADSFPEWTFHLFGRRAKIQKKMGNVRQHGELSFEAVVPYIKFADIGVAPYRQVSGVEYLCQSSLKLVQYSYCRLSIVAPSFVVGERADIFGYEPGNSVGLVEAFGQASAFSRRANPSEDILSWNDVIDAILDAAFEDGAKATAELAVEGR